MIKKSYFDRKDVDSVSRKIFNRSGRVKLNGKYISFIYLLMRDHLPTGKVEDIVRQIEKDNDSCEYSNGWLAKYAEDLTKRITKKEKRK